MPIITRLDNVLPPTYDGVNPEAGDPFVDADSAVRATTGDDTYHYSVDQRVEGDLMVRDLILLQNQRNLFEHFGTNGPTKVLIPTCVVPNGELVIAKFETYGSIAVAHCRLEVARLYDDLEATTQYQIKVLNSLGVTLFNTSSAVAIPWVPLSSNLTLLAAPGVFSVVLVNLGAQPVMMSGSVVLSNPPT